MPDYKSKSDSLLLHQNLTTATQERMDETRKKFVEVAHYVENLGDSREVSLAFTHIEQALQYTIKHLCMVDPDATLRPLTPPAPVTPKK